MKQRLISAFFAVILLVVVLLCNQYVLDGAVVIISSMAIFEVISALNLKEYKIMTTIALLMPAFLLLTFYIDEKYINATAFLFIAAFLLTMLFDHKRYTFDTATKFITVSLMISLMFIHVTFIRHADNGVLNLLVALIGCWITDSCAYFTGYACGRHKLAPTISPKKTIEGSIGGILGVIIILTAYALIAANIFNITANVASAVIIGLICGILSQLGDLCASIIKRENNVKDFGNIMPGHGGVMDRFDSFIFVAPVVYYLLGIFPVFM